MDVSPGFGQRAFERFTKLEARLQRLRARWLEVSQEPGFVGFEPWQDRLAAHVSLRAVIEFLDQDPDWQKQELCWGLTRLLFALDDVGKSIPVPMLSPSRGKGLPLKPDVVDGIRGRCAAVMERLIKTGRSREVAGARVLDLLGVDAVRKLAGRAGKRPPTWHTIDKWRAPLTGRADPSPALDCFRHQMALFAEREATGEEVDAIATVVLKVLHRRILDPTGWLAIS